MSAILASTPAHVVAEYVAMFGRNKFQADDNLCWSFNLRKLQGQMAIGKVSRLAGGFHMHGEGEVRISTTPAGYFGRSLGAEMKRKKNLFLVSVYDGPRGQLYLRTPDGWRMIEGGTQKVSNAEYKAVSAFFASQRHPLADASAALRAGPTRKVSRAPIQLLIDMDDGTEPFPVSLAGFVESNRGTGADEEVASWARSARVGTSRTFGGGAAGTYTVTVLDSAPGERLTIRRGTGTAKRVRMPRIDQRDYTHYVLCRIGKVESIESGWSYASDASDRVKEARQEKRAGATYSVVTRAALVARGIDPTNNANWLTNA